MIYFIEATEIDSVKIGFSLQPWRRLEQLQTGSPFKLRLVACISGTEEDERRLHQRFQAFRKTGEWFELVWEIRSLYVLPWERELVCSEKNDKDSLAMLEHALSIPTESSVLFNSMRCEGHNESQTVWAMEVLESKEDENERLFQQKIGGKIWYGIGPPDTWTCRAIESGWGTDKADLVAEFAYWAFLESLEKPKSEVAA